MRRDVIFLLLVGVIGTGVLVALGLWQWQRMGWKEALLADLDARIAAAPVALPESPDPARDKFLPVMVDGRFTGQELFMLMGVKGGTPGVEVIAAFKAADGRLLMVDRGFLPDEARTTPRPPRDALVTGNLHWPDDSDGYTPPPDAATGLWFSRDVAAMAEALGTEPLLVVARDDTGDGIAPMPVNSLSVPNNHFGYAVQWFLMAVVWAGMTLLWLSRKTARKA